MHHYTTTNTDRIMKSNQSAYSQNDYDILYSYICNDTVLTLALSLDTAVSRIVVTKGSTNTSV